MFLLSRQLWQRLTGEKESLAPLWIAAVWLLHPINLAPVLLVVQRMTSLAALFMLAAIVLYLHGRTTGGKRGGIAIAVAALVCWPLSLMSKETALLLPFFILVCECLVLDGLRAVSTRMRWLGGLILIALIAAVVAAAWSRVGAGYAFRDFGPFERLLTEARVLWFYLLELLLPWPGWFSLYHDDFAISRNPWTPPETLPAIAAWLAVAALAIRYRKRTPLPGFALAWFLVGHMLESTILPLEIAYEHRNYLASIGILLLPAGWLFAASSAGQERRLKLMLAAGVVIVCALVTGLRASQWGDEYRRTSIEAANHPESARANYEAAVALMERTFLGTAGGSPQAYRKIQTLLTRAAELDRSSKVPLIGLLYLDCAAGRPGNPVLQAQLRERFAAAPFVPGDRGTIFGLSELLVEKRLCLEDAEVDQLLKAALSNPAAVGVFRGMIHTVAMDYAAAKIRSLPLALAHAGEAVRSDPASVPWRVNLVRLLMASGDKSSSRREYDALTRLPAAPADRANVAQLGRDLENMERKPNAR